MALRIAYFGQAPFGRDVLVRLLEAGHQIAGVYAPPARPGAKADPLAEEAEKRGLALFRHAAMRKKTGEPIASRIAEHAALHADLNVLAFVTMILPPEIVDAPRLGSLCFHPSLLPKFRGGNALAWQIIAGEREAGVTVFKPDAGVDAGPIVVQKGQVPILPHHTAASLYFESLYALGVEAMVEAVARVADGTATFTPQDESRASFQGLVDDAVARIDWSRGAAEIDRLVRGCDPNPGAHARRGAEVVRLFGCTLAEGFDFSAPPGTVIGLDAKGARIAARGGVLSVAKLRVGAGGKANAAEAGIAVGDALA
ncbi:MAG TPA: methionyl-tRNA formyltransferase [Myxococcota bacterium]|nr:methionyl-tRNA formyltransferase [Myxococcota bacterium]